MPHAHSLIGKNSNNGVVIVQIGPEHGMTARYINCNTGRLLHTSCVCCTQWTTVINHWSNVPRLVTVPSVQVVCFSYLYDRETTALKVTVCFSVEHARVT